MDDDVGAMDVQPTFMPNLLSAPPRPSRSAASWAIPEFTFDAKPNFPGPLLGTKRQASDDPPAFNLTIKRPHHDFTPPSASAFEYRSPQPLSTIFTPAMSFSKMPVRKSPPRTPRAPSSKLIWQQSHKKIRAARSLILDLPRELRDMVYECCLSLPGVIVVRDTKMGSDPSTKLSSANLSNGMSAYCTYKPPSYFKNPRPELLDTSFSQFDERSTRTAASDRAEPCETRHTSLSHVKPLLAALLRTCKQVHYEAAEILYGHNFEISQPSGSFLKLQTLSINTLPSTYAPFIKNIRFHFWWLDFGTTRETWRPFCENSWGGMKQLQLLYPNLQKLTIVMGKKGTRYPWEPRDRGQRCPGNLGAILRLGFATLKPAALERRLCRWFDLCFALPSCSIPELVEFELEDENVNRKVVKKAWTRFREWHDEQYRQKSDRHSRRRVVRDFVEISLLP